MSSVNFSDVSMESVGNGKTTENIGANDDLVPIDIRAESQARKEHENIEAGNLGLNCEGSNIFQLNR